MKYFFLALSIMILFAACSKNSTPASSNLTTLTTGKWRISNGTITLRLPDGLDTTINYLYWIPYCHQDDYIEFKTSTQGYSYPGSITCNPSEADSIGFIWNLANNGTTMNFEGFNFNYTVSYSVVDPCFFDTLSKSPLQLDTIVSAAAAKATGGVVVLDSTWDLKFDSVNMSDINTYNATITNLSAASFTLNYSLITTYLDTTNHHTGPPTDLSPLVKPDTIRYSVTYTNF